MDAEPRTAFPAVRYRHRDYELYEEDGEFVLSGDLPGFEKDDIDVSWYDCRLNIAAERENEERGRRRTYHRSFRLPKEVEADDIAASYTNGVLEVVIPIADAPMPRGKTITVE